MRAVLAIAEMRNVALGGLDPIRDSHIAAWWRDSFDTYHKVNARLLKVALRGRAARNGP